MSLSVHRYRKVSTKIWSDRTFKRLSDSGKLLFLYLLTHPSQTRLGIFRTTKQGLAAELGWTWRRFNGEFNKLLRAKIVLFDDAGPCVYLPRFIRHNTPESPNVIKSWPAAFDDIPECELKDISMVSMRIEAESLPEAFSKAFQEAFLKTIPNQEQEQEQEQEKKNIKKKSAVVDDLPVKPVSLSAFEHWVAEWTDRYDEPPTIGPKHFGEIEKLEAHLGRPALKARIDRCLQSQDPFWTSKRHPVGLFVAQVDRFAPTPAEKPTGARQRDPANYGRKVLRADA